MANFLSNLTCGKLSVRRLTKLAEINENISLQRSYGILLMELFTYGQVPYPGMHSREVIEQIERGYRMPKPTNHQLPDSIYNLMLTCWDAVPEKRPTFEFLNHYFESFSVTSEVPYKEVHD